MTDRDEVILHPCPYGVATCLCQRCEVQERCNNGMDCFECRIEGKAVHNIYLCTGFYGTYPHGGRREQTHEPA